MRKFLRFFFYHFYHGFSWSYDFVAAAVSIGRWNEWVRAALPYLHGPRVLEIGFGPGHLQVELNRREFITFGLDESHQMADRTRNRLTRNRLPVVVSRGVAQHLPFAANSLDSMVATFPSEYIMDRVTLLEAWRVLKPTGRLVVVPTAWIGGRSLPDQAAKWLFRVTGQGTEITDNLEDRIKLIFNPAGFRVEIIRVEIRLSTVLVILADKNPLATPSPDLV